MDAKPPQIDELWFSEYVEFGWGELVAYLQKQAKFWLYLVTNHRLEEEESS